ncbi:tripartite motif-containing protein 16-like [Thunnus thynnus]|uniref:tripartite motif-containing protein 16-like n=1 Tax=Thunnus thynnus TaxID=8237 RepID=UPI003528E42E
MAQQRMDQEKLCCSICLDLLKDPVTIPCGHNYCMNCIKSYWDGDDQKKICSCPQCRNTFRPRPVLVKNTMLAELVEELKKTGLQAAPPDHCYAGPEDVACDFCTGRKLKALKSCLQCLVSYCEQHLQPHYESPAFEKHKLVDPSKTLHENICSHHGKIMKIFCRTDQKCICYLCSMDEHKGHDTVSAAAGRNEKQKELKASQQKIKKRIQDREKDVKMLQQEVETINNSADQAVRDSENIFNELIRLIEKRSSDVKQQIRSQQRTEVSRAKELQKKLQQEITDLRRKDAELVQLSHTGDHTQFLQKYASLSQISKSTDSPRIHNRPLSYFENVAAAVSGVRDKLEGILSEVWTKISSTEIEVDVLLPQSEFRTRGEFLQYSQQITMDPSTANTELILSEGNRKVTVKELTLSTAVGWVIKSFVNQPETSAFQKLQVLSRESLSERCYWEVEWSGEEVSIAVTYNNIRRTQEESEFGQNDKSWALHCVNKKYTLRHDKRNAYIVCRPSRVGVYLDQRAGILSFYSVSDTMTLLHRVQTTFTQPLYAGLKLVYDATVELCEFE